MAGVALFAALTATVLRLLSGEAGVHVESATAMQQRLAALADLRSRGTLSETAFAAEVERLAADPSVPLADDLKIT